VAYSRVYTGVHYPSDVVAGIGIGIGSGVLAARSPWRC
jgi:membrane-associated phospholipid phosphatase